MRWTWGGRVSLLSWSATTKMALSVGLAASTHEVSEPALLETFWRNIDRSPTDYLPLVEFFLASDKMLN